MTLEQLQAQQKELLVQRAALKDQVDQIERGLGQIGFAIQAMTPKQEGPTAVETE